MSVIFSLATLDVCGVAQLLWRASRHSNASLAITVLSALFTNVPNVGRQHYERACTCDKCRPLLWKKVYEPQLSQKKKKKKRRLRRMQVFQSHTTFIQPKTPRMTEMINRHILCGAVPWLLSCSEAVEKWKQVWSIYPEASKLQHRRYRRPEQDAAMAVVNRQMFPRTCRDDCSTANINWISNKSRRTI